MSRRSSSQCTFRSTIMFSQLLIMAVVVCSSVRADASHAQYLPPKGNGNGANGNGNGGKLSNGGGVASGNGASAPGGGNDGGVSSDGGSGPGEEGGKPEPFSFSYEVKDAESGNDYSHKADSDGTVVKGEYQVLLPDGRRQTVNYTADSTGYNADVQYEGEAITSEGAGAGEANGAGGAGTGGATGAAGAGGANGASVIGGSSASGSAAGSSGGAAGYPSGGPGGNGGGNGYPSGRPKSSYLPPRK